MLQLISGSTRRKANKCEPLLSRAGKEMELFPACTRAPGSLGGAAWIFEQHRSGGTVSLFLSGTLSPDIRLEGGGLSPGQDLRESTWETMTTTFDKKRAKLREHRGMTRPRGRRRSVSLPPVTEDLGETSDTPTRLQQLRRSGGASDRLLAWGGGRQPGSRPHGTQCG